MGVCDTLMHIYVYIAGMYTGERKGTTMYYDIHVNTTTLTVWHKDWRCTARCSFMLEFVDSDEMWTWVKKHARHMDLVGVDGELKDYFDLFPDMRPDPYAPQPF